MRGAVHLAEPNASEGRDGPPFRGLGYRRATGLLEPDLMLAPNPDTASLLALARNPLARCGI